MKRLCRLIGVSTLLTLALGDVAEAQVASPVGGRAGGRASLQPRPKANARILLEQRVQARVNEIVRARLALTDEQVEQLRVASARFDEENRVVRADEIASRTALRRQLLAGEGANEAQVAELLDRLPKLERRRIDIMEAEQKELARFLSPSQRARYFALQDELRRNLQDAQRRRSGGAAASDDTLPNAGKRLLPLRPGAGRRLRPPPPAKF